MSSSGPSPDRRVTGVRDLGPTVAPGEAPLVLSWSTPACTRFLSMFVALRMASSVLEIRTHPSD